MISENNKVKSEDLGFALYEMRNDGCIVLRLVDDLMIDIEKAKLMDAALAKMTTDGPKKILVITGKFTSADDEARQFLASHVKEKQIEKTSVVIHSLSQRLLANFFLKVNKPAFKIRFFTDAHQAEKWLLSE